MLARALQNRGEDGIAAAREVGRSFGASLINRRAASTGAAVRLLAPLGAEYVVTHGEVVARNCIFREACAESMEIVCELHGGLLEGAFQQAGLKVRIEAFRDYPEHGCAYRVINA